MESQQQQQNGQGAATANRLIEEKKQAVPSGRSHHSGNPHGTDAARDDELEETKDDDSFAEGKNQDFSAIPSLPRGK